MKQIVIDVMADGEIKIETKGFTGPVCLEESQFLKDLLGKEISVQLCPVFYQKRRKILKKHIPICG